MTEWVFRSTDDADGESSPGESSPGESSPGELPRDGSVPGTPSPELTWQGLWLYLKGAWARFGRVTSDPAVVAVLLAAILLLAGILRFTGLDWDEHQHLHPDERFLTMVENSLQWPQSFREYLDTAKNPLNPYNKGHGTFVYGLSPLVVAKFLGQISGNTGYDGVYLAGRAMSAGMDMLCIMLVFLIGRRLYDTRVGLLSALLLSLTALDIQHSHFFTVDSATTLYVTLALYLAVLVAQGRGWGAILLLGVAFGLAVSAKISVLTFLAVIALAYALRIWARWKCSQDAAPLRAEARGRLGRVFLSLKVEPNPCCAPSKFEALFWLAVRVLFSGIVLLLVAVMVFRVAQPQAFVGPGLFDFKFNPEWREDMKYIQDLVSGKIDYPPSHQWAGREPIWYMWKNMVLWGLGVPLGIAVWASWAYMAYEMVRKHTMAHLLPWVWVTLTFFYQSIQFVKTIRYLLPIYPTMAVIAAYGLVRLWDWGKRRHEVVEPTSQPEDPGAATAGVGPVGTVAEPGLAVENQADAAMQQSRRSRSWRRWAWPVAMAAVLSVVLGTAFWAIAFTSIYTRPVSRIAASRWIYENLPAGTHVSFELWDDAVPLNVDGHNASLEYPGVRMDLYWEDIPDKREQLYAAIQEADIIALTSNRLYESIPRLPQRYPMTTRYYEALFSGELGFERLASFTSRPRLFGIEIADDRADETFTVYDHPKVILFKKSADFSMARVYELFGGYELERIVRVMPRQVTSAPNNLMLSEDLWSAQRQGGTWSRIFRRDGLTNRLPVLAWVVALLLIGLIAFPLGFVAFRRLRDRGYLLSKTLGLLLLAYLSWLLASVKLLPYTRATIFGILGVLLLASAVVAWVQRRALWEFIMARWRMLLVGEILFWCFFLVFLLIRMGNPDLWHPAMGGEKPMDFAYLNAIIKSTYFPPYDPWFAGGYINYYYYGAMVVATLIKFTGVVPWVAYNLAIPTFFALTASGAMCVAFNLIPSQDDEGGWFPRALRFGLLGALLVAVLGNLGEVHLFWNGFRELGKGALGEASFVSTIPGLDALVQAGAGLWAWLIKGKSLPFRPEWWYWNASRIMQHGEINEFPFFTFLYADLHAHLTAMPFALLALGLATSLVVRPMSQLSALARDVRQVAPGSGARRLRRHGMAQRIDWALALQLTLLALVVGELWCNNTWDYPTYLLISVAALGIGLYGDYRRIDQPLVIRFALRAAYILVLSMLLYVPYHANFGSGYSSVELWKGERTPLGAYLLIHGPQLFVLATFVLALALERRTSNGVVRATRLWLKAGARRPRFRHLYNLLIHCQTLGYDLGWAGLVCLGVVLLAFLLARAWLLLLAVPLLIVGVLLTLRRVATPERRFQSFLFALALALTLLVEYIVLKGDIGRMNTVFKFYLQVWMLWGVLSAVALAYLDRRVRAWRPGARKAWMWVLALLLVGASLYPIFATYGKVRDRWNSQLPPGLDGMHYMTAAEYGDNGHTLTLEYDRQAIIWMQDHIAGSPVIVEASTPLYRWGNRISIYTGLPTIIGWDWHQKQQRAAFSGEVVDWRLQDLGEIYNSTDIVRTVQLLARYHVGFVYVGELEQAYYGAEGLAKFETMVGSTLEVVYRQGPVTIYHVLGSDEQEGAVGALPGTRRGGGLWGWITRHWLGGAVEAQGPGTSSPVPEKEPSGNLTSGFTNKTLLLDQPVDQLPALRDRGWNRWASQSTLLAVVIWWVVLQIIGLAAWPLAARYLSGFADLGYGVAKGLGLLLVSYLVWIGASLRLMANSPPVAWGALFLLGVCSFFLGSQAMVLVAWVHSRPRHDPNCQTATPHARQHSRRLILLEEGLFTAAFLAFVGIRLMNPDLWQPWFGGEKMMEIAFLNALTKSAHMPPYDPYFAGGYINYYYYGLFITNVLIKLTGIVPEVAFNLAVPTFFALTIQHAFVVGYHLLPVARLRLRAGLLAAAWVAILGNLSAVTQLFDGLARLGGATFASGSNLWLDLLRVFPGLWWVLSGQADWPAFDYWYRATRIIPNTINEFPFFSFLFADLHPHMIAIPFTVLVVALCLHLLYDSEGDARARGGSILALGRWPILAIVVGALGAINTWDLPAYLLLLGGCLLVRGHRLKGARGILEALIVAMLIALTSLLVYAPFYANYQAQYVGLSIVAAGERSPLGDFLLIWGGQLLLIASLLVFWIATDWPWAGLARAASRDGLLGALRRVGRLSRRGLGLWVLALVGLVLAVALGVALAVMRMSVLALLVALLGAAGVSLLRMRSGRSLLSRLLVLVGLGILLGIEFVYLRDFLAGSEWRRMNTVFKFFTQAWILFGLAIGGALPMLWQRAARRGGPAVGLWKGLCVVFMAAALLYPVQAIPARASERFPGARVPAGTLDGTAYMETATYAWPDGDHRVELAYDREAIAWLIEEVQGTPVIAEAALGYYREGGMMVASYTGLPVIIGVHENEQRPSAQVDARDADVATLYATSDMAQFEGLLAQYRVAYIYVGQLERLVYAGPGMTKFEEAKLTGLLERVYHNESVDIYRVLRNWEIAP